MQTEESVLDEVRKGKVGMYNPARRYSFTNIDKEEFSFSWNKVAISVKPDETIEIPEYLAVHATNMLIDKIMIRDHKAKEEAYRAETKDRKARLPSQLGVPAIRKEFEDKILKPLKQGATNDSQLDVTRAKLLEEIKRDIDNAKEIPPPLTSFSQVSGASSANLSEFEEINVPKTH